VCGGCGSSRSSVIQQPVPGYHADSLRLVAEGADGLVITEDQRRTLVKAFEDRVYDARAFQRGQSGLTASYHVTAGNPGSRGLRFWIGLWTGEGTITVEVEWRTAAGVVCARTQHTGVVSGGAFGGSWNKAFEKCGNEIGEFAITTFLER